MVWINFSHWVCALCNSFSATVKVISEQISNVSATGVALDAGIQYVTGPADNLKFGISLKNVGPRMSFTGDGLSFRGIVGDGDDYKMTVEQRSSEFELPALLNMGVAYDINFNNNKFSYFIKIQS